MKTARQGLMVALVSGMLCAGTWANVTELTDGGFDTDSEPLLPWGPLVLDRWLAEAADLVTGLQPDNVSPWAGDGMLRIEHTFASTSQVRQRVDASSLAASIEAGHVVMKAVGMVNAGLAGVEGGINASALDANGTQVAFASGRLLLDDDPSTWQPSQVLLPLPPDTRFVQMQFFADNASLPSSGDYFYGDGAEIKLSSSVAPQVLTDPGLDSDSQPLGGFTQLLLDRWLQEEAALVTGLQDDGVAPLEGDGMLQLAHTGGSSSQVRQRVDISSHAALIDAGWVTAIASGFVNAGTSGTVGGVLLSARDGDQASLDVLSGSMALDGDVTSWEASIVCLALPPGTRFVEMQFVATNASLPDGEFVYGDAAGLSLGVPSVCWQQIVGGLPGTFGIPSLTGHASIIPGEVGSLDLANALPLAPAALFVGLGPAGPGVPFKGGILTPVPILLVFSGLVTDGAGQIGLPFVLGPETSGVSLVLQYAIADAAAIQGVALSNPLQMDVP